MSAIQHALVSFFGQVAKKDDAWIRDLKNEREFRVENRRWCFTLPALHSFLQCRDELFADIDYKQFRKIIYSSSINEAIQSHGARVTIVSNRSLVDQSTYALVWQDL